MDVKNIPSEQAKIYDAIKNDFELVVLTLWGKRKDLVAIGKEGDAVFKKLYLSKKAYKRCLYGKPVDL